MSSMRRDSNLKKPGELVNLVNFLGGFEFVMSRKGQKRKEKEHCKSLTPKQVNEVHKFTDVLSSVSETKKGVRGENRQIISRVSKPTHTVCELIEHWLTLMSEADFFIKGKKKGWGAKCELHFKV